jgi:phage/plasmid-like protein (TIGR03299 family)
MSHEIDQSTGKAAMAYVGELGKPWHGLGTSIKKGISAKEVGEAAGLLWGVKQAQVQFEQGKKLATDPAHVVMYRDDTGMVLDITGKGYVPHQNIDVLEFFQEYLSAGDMFIDTAGSLNEGRQIWVQAKLERGFTLGDTKAPDLVQGRILLMNPHQYGKGMVAKFVAERVVCWNTLTMALSEGGKSVKIWHTSEFNKARRDSIKRDLGIAKERLDAFEDNARKLTKLRLQEIDAVKLIAPVFGGDEKKELNQQGKTVIRIIELWNGAGQGATLPTARGTGWGLLNAVTQYIDHEYGRSEDSRLTNAWLGHGEKVKREALKTLLTASAN